MEQVCGGVAHCATSGVPCEYGDPGMPDCRRSVLSACDPLYRLSAGLLFELCTRPYAAAGLLCSALALDCLIRVE